MANELAAIQISTPSKAELAGDSAKGEYYSRRVNALKTRSLLDDWITALALATLFCSAAAEVWFSRGGMSAN